ncbi:hypothetical protein ACSFCM_07965 [Enterococcus gilvus]
MKKTAPKMNEPAEKFSIKMTVEIVSTVIELFGIHFLYQLRRILASRRLDYNNDRCND